MESTLTSLPAKRELRSWKWSLLLWGENQAATSREITPRTPATTTRGMPVRQENTRSMKPLVSASWADERATVTAAAAIAR